MNKYGGVFFQMEKVCVTFGFSFGKCYYVKATSKYKTSQRPKSILDLHISSNTQWSQLICVCQNIIWPVLKLIYLCPKNTHSQPKCQNICPLISQLYTNQNKGFYIFRDENYMKNISLYVLKSGNLVIHHIIFSELIN